jgi:hypothetical protein
MSNRGRLTIKEATSERARGGIKPEGVGHFSKADLGTFWLAPKSAEQVYSKTPSLSLRLRRMVTVAGGGVLRVWCAVGAYLVRAP